ncbi:DUF4118 domain-containing protein [Oscillospiraceae bacterium WX1]
MHKQAGNRRLAVTRWVVLTLALTGAATAVGTLFNALGFPETNIVLVYLLAVLLTAWLTDGYYYGIASAVLATFLFNYFFTEPYFTLRVNNPDYLITFCVLTVTSIITSALTTHAKQSTMAALEKEAETAAVYKLTSRLSGAQSFDEITQIAEDVISSTFSCRANLLECNLSGSLDLKFVRPFGTNRLKNSFVRLSPDMYADEEYWPILGRERILAVIRIPEETARSMNDAQSKLMCAMLESTALAIERLEASEQTAQTREEAERERFRGNLLRAISHDLRTPLSGMIGTSEILMSMTEKNDPRYILAEGLYKSADWLRAMVENILSLTRLQDGRLILEKQPEAIEEVVGEAVCHVAQYAPEYEIVPRIPPQLLLVPMDAKLIKQVLINLLDNAVKHTPPQEEIIVLTEVDGPFARVTVRDGGSGIPETDMPHLFQMFFTSKSNPTDGNHGIGLGLAICEAIVKAHGGSISARNRPDRRGAEFIFTLPLEVKDE